MIYMIDICFRNKVLNFLSSSRRTSLLHMCPKEHSNIIEKKNAPGLSQDQTPAIKKKHTYIYEGDTPKK